MRILAVLVTVAVLASCTGGDPDDTETPSPTGPAAVEIPDTRLGERVTWVIDAINRDDPHAADVWEAAFDATFLDAVSADEVVDLMDRQFRPARPWTPTAYDEFADQAVATIESAEGERLDMTVVLDDEGLMTGLLFVPAAEQHEPATSFEEVEQGLDDLPGDVHVRVTLEQDGRTETIIERSPDEPAPIASVAKLFVLIAVLEQVEAGAITWDDRVEVTDDVRSLPSGRLQDAEPGTEVTVYEAAKGMIEISDNTATDLLIKHIGRETVEASIDDLGLSDSEGLVPFPTTRELFALSWGVDRATADAWAAGDAEERRAVLDGLTDEDLDVGFDDVTWATSWQRGANWYASPEDVARALERLADLGDRHREVGQILGANPGSGLSFDREAWPAIWFKGGSSRGVVAGVWRATSADGRVLTVIVMLAGESSREVDAVASVFFGLATDVFTLTQ